MSALSQPSALLTVRGTVIPTEIDAARNLHNQTAGSPEGVAGARALGDLSHKVYTALPGAPGAAENEVLFIDVWKNAEGIGTFFSDAQVQHGAAMLFSEREAVIWMPAEGAFGFELPAPMHLTGHFLGIARGPIDDPQHTIKIFRESHEPDPLGGSPPWPALPPAIHQGADARSAGSGRSHRSGLVGRR